MSKLFKDFHEAWHWLHDHPYYYCTEENEWCERMKIEPINSSVFLRSLAVDVVKVNPKTMHIDEDDTLNTLTQVWLESGTDVWDDNLKQWLYIHNYDLDCGADTYEEAIMNLAELVLENYGDYVVDETSLAEIRGRLQQ